MRRRKLAALTSEEAYQRLSLDALGPIGKRVSPDAPTRKSDLVPFLLRAMSEPDTLKRLYGSLGELNRAAVQEVVHHDFSGLNVERFRAKYGRPPGFGSGKEATLLWLFLPYENRIPTDLEAPLKAFVPRPRGVTVPTLDALPEALPRRYRYYKRPEGKDEPVPLRLRESATPALQEVRALLHLIEDGKIQVSDKTGRPTQATVNLVRGLLVGGDFYDVADHSKDDWDPSGDLTMRAFAWPLLLQASGLAATAGTRLQLSASGRKALGQPPHEVVEKLWEKWLGTTKFDEFHRIDVIKGQKKARLTAAAGRRDRLADALADCPVGRWIAVDAFFTFVRANGCDFEVARGEWDLYIGEQPYGSLGYRDAYAWQQVQGRYTLAFLLEYVATLGLIDVAYVVPQDARDDFHRRWGVDEFSCLSRYDGLHAFRINALGQWCLGRDEQYVPEERQHAPCLRVLPNLEVVAVDGALEPADVLLLDRVAERTSESVWRLDRSKLLATVEGGFVLSELDRFLEARIADPLPQTVSVFLADVQDRASRLRDLGPARLIECADPETAHLLVNDRELKALCQLAGDRRIVCRTRDEATVRSRLRKLGYVVPLNK